MAIPITLILLSSWVVLAVLENQNKPFSGIKLIWAWSVRPDRAIDPAVAAAQDMGFNAVGWGNPGVVPACHVRGMKAFALVSPLSLQREGAIPQVLSEGEEKLPGFDRSLDNPQYPFQYGGKPAPGNKEVLHINLACPRDPGVIDYGVAEATRFRKLGYDGVCWDFIGYRNYHSCECDRCRADLGGLTAITREAFYLSSLTGLYARLYQETKKVNPELLIATHIYPVYLPDIHYGEKVMADFCGETVSWFFQPHWHFEKIRSYTRKTLNSSRDFRQMEAMPMIGFYSDGEFSRDKKGADRLELELRILRIERTKHFMMCELGHLLRDPGAMKAVKGSL
jgi:hypothetical protein